MISRSLYPLFLPIIQKIVVMQNEFRVASFYSFPFFFCISFLRDLLQNHNVLRIVLNCLVFFYTSSIRDCLSYASTPLLAFPVSYSRSEMGYPFLERESVNGKRESGKRDDWCEWRSVMPYSWCEHRSWNSSINSLLPSGYSSEDGFGSVRMKYANL